MSDVVASAADKGVVQVVAAQRGAEVDTCVNLEPLDADIIGQIEGVDEDVSLVEAAPRQRGLDDHITRIADVVDVIAIAALHGVITKTAIEGVVAIAPNERVVAVTANERIVAKAAIERIVTATAV